MDGETSSTTAGKRGIFAAMMGVMAEVGAIGKTKKNVQQGYQFRGIDDVLAVLQPLFIKHGIFCVPKVLKAEREVLATKSGGSMASVRLLVEHTFFAADGSSVYATTYGEAMDSGDKASNKAMSAALKYALTESFSIPTYESDRDTEEASPALAAAPAAKTSPVAVPRSESGRAATFAPDEVEKEKGLLRALFETSTNVAELDAHWARVKKLPSPADIAEVTVPFKARKTVLTQQAAK